MACVFFLVLAVPLTLDPRWWFVAAMFGVWALGLLLALRWFVRRPVAVAVLPLVLGVAWFVAIVVGARAGWVT